MRNLLVYSAGYSLGRYIVWSTRWSTLLSTWRQFFGRLPFGTSFFAASPQLVLSSGPSFESPTMLTGSEIAHWLLEHAADRPVCISAPEYARHVPAEVMAVRVAQGALYIPAEADAIAGRSDIVLIIAGRRN